MTFDHHRAALAATMDQRGAWPARSSWIRRAVATLPRDAFAPDRLWCWDGYAYVPLDRSVDPERWATEVYASPDTAAVTQVTGGVPSSSLSAQGIVVDMLDSLLLEPGHRVLELGTGTGWNAALLAQRVGADGRVVSVEVDPELAGRAAERLKAVGAEVAVHVGDGAAGCPPGGPYDRVISTYAVDAVPWAWVEQTRPGGRIVTPWGHLGHVALTVADDGRSASGWVQGLATFMPARGTGPGRDFAEVRGDGPPTDERPVTRDIAPLRDDWHLLFALRVALPDVRITTAIDEDGVNTWLHDGITSWATLAATGDGGTIAFQGGPRRLADELERVWAAWLALGGPPLYDYGLTVEPERQYAWCEDAATGPRWPVRGRS
ncbi:methyltransferase domain-containing protein [Streptomyces coffeae]|uniref:Protein-L-isoaspartate O-methyltransferase n=1 Tax=Streptomyces coffeae TaxID=621382 RepID=A0ABS1NL91_9ACTN|nr:methyltransferase domain-containing protein [Streptomyces coffeae]MBL1100866.1 methyltransferase domain-containing protein [Streptomyces coffeae]